MDIKIKKAEGSISALMNLMRYKEFESFTAGLESDAFPHKLIAHERYSTQN